MLRAVFRQAGEDKLEFRLEGEGIRDAPWRPIEAPFSPAQLDDLRWYVEEFMDLPVGGYVVRAKRVEGSMEAAGRRLLDAVFPDRPSGAALDRTLALAPSERWLEVAAETGTSAEPLAWPWELLHDETGYLSLRRLRVRRTLPQGSVTPARVARGEGARTRGLRVLVIVCRPDDQGLVAPRATVDAMLRAVAEQPVRVDLCRLGTLAALSERLGRAVDEGDPYDIVHVNAHGRFQPRDGASLAFEKDPDETGRIETARVTPEALGEVLHDKGVDLVVLEACQSAAIDTDSPLTAGFAQGLLQKGIQTVVAMGYTVHVDATKRLFGALYERIAAGATIGEALTTARERLREHPLRQMGFGPAHERADVDLRDWFVPQLYQHGDDRRLLPPGTAAEPAPKPPLLRRSETDDPRPGAFPGEPPYAFVGRVAELHKVGRALERSPAVLVHGLAGTGKTTLAVEVASWGLRTRRFEDALFVDFRAVVSEGHALSIMGAALLGGVTADRAAIVAAFRKREVLVVWDNLETLAGAEPREVAALGTLFREMVRDEGGAPVAGRLLMTSRDPRPGDWKVEARVPIEGLWRPDARELLSRVLLAVDPPVRFRDVLEREGRAAGAKGAEEITADGRQAIDDLLEFLGYHALSIEVAGPALATESASAIQEGIAKKLEEATAGGEGPEAERLRRLGASLAWSIGRLDEDARELLRWLALFRGGVHEQQVVLVSEMEVSRLEAGRAQLVRGGLVAMDRTTMVNKRPYLVLHPTITLLGARELEADAGVRRRFVVSYYELSAGIERSIHGSAETFHAALTAYAREEANLARAIAWAPPEVGPTMRRTAASCLESLGRAAEASRLVAVELLPGASWRDRIHQALGMVTKDPTEALRRLATYASELEMGVPEGTDQDTALAFLALGRALLTLGRPAEAVPHLETGAGRYRGIVVDKDMAQHGAPWSDLATVLGDLGNAYVGIRALGKAEAVIREGLRINTALDDRRSIAAGRGQLAGLRVAQGRLDDARREYQRALVAADSCGDRGLAGAIEQHLGSLEDDRGHLDVADAHYRRALDHFLFAGNFLAVTRTRDLLGILSAKRDDWAAAGTWLNAALAGARDLGRQDLEATSLHNLGVLHHKMGMTARSAGNDVAAARDFAEATRLIQDSLDIWKRIGNPSHEAACYFQLGVLWHDQGRLAEAYENLLEGSRMAERLESVDIHMDYFNLAEVAAELGNTAEAQRWRTKADDAEASAAFLAQRPTFLAGMTRIAAAARTGDLGPASEENERLASYPGWLGALAAFFTATAAGASPPLPDGVHEEAASVIRRVLAGEEPEKVLAELFPVEAPPSDERRPSAPRRDPREVVVLASAALSAALLRDGRACSPTGEQCIRELADPLERYLAEIAAGRDPGPPPDLPAPFDQVFVALFVHRRPPAEVALSLMAGLVDRDLADLCAAVARAPAGTPPPPEVTEALAQLAAVDDPAQAAVGAYLQARLSPTPGPLPTFGEPLDTLLAAVFPTNRSAEPGTGA